MTKPEKSSLVSECLTSLESVGEIERWVEQRGDGSVGDADLAQAYRDVTRRLLEQDPPETAVWERLLFTSAVRSSVNPGQTCLDACKAAISELVELIDSDALRGADSDRIVTLASALTLALTAQHKLRQTIEDACGRIVDHFERDLPDIAGRCQDIWQRRGQMSGANSLYVWDSRRSEWRLSQDFKPYRPPE